MRAFYALILLAGSNLVGVQAAAPLTADDARDAAQVQAPTIYLAPTLPVAPAVGPELKLEGPGGNGSSLVIPRGLKQTRTLSPWAAPPVQAAPLPPQPAAASATSHVVTPISSPVTVISNPGFTIGPGDTIQIEVLGHAELAAKGNVSGDGRVSVALLGPVVVGGLSPLQASEQIAKAYRDGRYLVSPQVTVTMIDYQSQLLSVLGEVRTPGRFPVKARLSILDGIALAGGVADRGGSIAYLLRAENNVVQRYEIDLDALVEKGAGQQYFEVLAGDTLMVPTAPLFYIYGEVRNPNAYKLKPGMTVIQALSLAGGLTDKGSNRRIDLRRKNAVDKLDTKGVSLFDVLSPDDVLYVKERLF